MADSNLFEKHAQLVIICVLVFGIIFSDFLFANIYKLVYGDSFYNTTVNPNIIAEKKYRISSDIYHHDLKKNVIATANWGPLQYPMITNSLGFRDKDNSNIAQKGDIYRIVFMGDSFVEGSGVPYPDSFVGILRQKYAPRFEILNAGVISYAPTVYYRKTRYLIEQQGLKFDEMVVLIDISDISDEVERYADYDEATGLDKPLPVIEPEEPKSQLVRQFFRNNSILYAIPRIIKNRKHDTSGVTSDPEKNPIITYRRSLWTVDKKLYDQYGVAGLKKAKANILNLKKLLDKHQIKLSLVVYPWPTQIYYNDLDSIQVREWQAFCQQNQITFVNLFPEFISENPEANKKALMEYYIKNDMHWNKKGNQKVAEALQHKLDIFSAK